MKSNLWVLWGVLLIIAGGVFLLDSLNLLEIGDVIWGFLLGFAGLAFLSVYASQRENWWALIPGIILLSISALILLEYFVQGGIGELAGTIVLGGIGLAFLLVYLNNREFWWALIPAGVMATLASIVALEGIIGDAGVGGVFFLGLGLTFAIVGLLPTPEGRMRWAFIPAGILSVIGVLLLVALSSLINYIWALALIAVGLILLIRAFRTRRG